MGNTENFDEGLTKTNPPKYFIYVCPECKGQVDEKNMGRRCPHCKEWLYSSLSKKEVVLVEITKVKNEI